MARQRTMLNMQIDEELKEAVRRIAEEERRTMSNLVEVWLEEKVKEYDAGKKDQ